LALLCDKQALFQTFSQGLSLLPGHPGCYLRRAFYFLVLDSCALDCYIGFGTIFSHPSAKIKSRVYIGPYCIVGNVTLEADVIIASRVSLINGSEQHGIEDLNIPINQQPGKFPHYVIGEDVWIGEGALVMRAVGTKSIIGAGSVVTREVEPYSVVVGNPGKTLRKRNS